MADDGSSPHQESSQNLPMMVFASISFSLLAGTVLLAFGFNLLWDSNDSRAVDEGNQQHLSRLASGVVFSQAISCYLWNASIVSDCITAGAYEIREVSVKTLRLCGVTTALCGLSLVLSSSWFGHTTTSDTFQIVAGVTVSVCSACSFVTSYFFSSRRDPEEEESGTADGDASTPLLANNIAEESTPEEEEEEEEEGLASAAEYEYEPQGGCDYSYPTEYVTDEQFDAHYQLGKQLGKGAFSVVNEGIGRKSKLSYAIKIIEKSKLTPSHERALKNEIDALTELRHPSIIHLFQVYDEKDKFFFVMEQLKGGELFDRIEQKSQYTEEEARDTALVLFRAIQHCHGHKIAHRDIKPENLLLLSSTNDSNIKIADFGFAKKCPDPDCLKTQCGTPAYVAPEILERKCYGTKVDCWSLGVVVYILLGGYPPFYEQSERELYRKIRKGRFCFHTLCWGRISESAKDMIRSLLVVDPTKRSSADDILENSWIHSSARELRSHDLRSSLSEFKKFNAKRKMKAAVKAVVAAQKLPSFGLDSS